MLLKQTLILNLAIASYKHDGQVAIWFMQGFKGGLTGSCYPHQTCKHGKLHSRKINPTPLTVSAFTAAGLN